MNFQPRDLPIIKIIDETYGYGFFIRGSVDGKDAVGVVNYGLGRRLIETLLTRLEDFTSLDEGLDDFDGAKTGIYYNPGGLWSTINEVMAKEGFKRDDISSRRCFTECKLEDLYNSPVPLDRRRNLSHGIENHFRRKMESLLTCSQTKADIYGFQPLKTTKKDIPFMVVRARLRETRSKGEALWDKIFGQLLLEKTKGEVERELNRHKRWLRDNLKEREYTTVAEEALNLLARFDNEWEKAKEDIWAKRNATMLEFVKRKRSEWEKKKGVGKKVKESTEQGLKENLASWYDKLLPETQLVRLFIEGKEIELAFFPTLDYLNEVVSQEAPQFPPDRIDASYQVEFMFERPLNRAGIALLTNRLLETGAAISCFPLGEQSFVIDIPGSRDFGGTVGRAFESRLAYIIQQLSEVSDEEPALTLQEEKRLDEPFVPKKVDSKVVLRERPEVNFALFRHMSSIDKKELPILAELGERYMRCERGNFISAFPKGDNVEFYHAVVSGCTASPNIWDHFPRIVDYGKGR